MIRTAAPKRKDLVETDFRRTVPKRAVWVGDFWDMFGAGHLLELKILRTIAEYRHRNGLPVTPDWMR